MGFMLVLGALLGAFVTISSFQIYQCFDTGIVAGQSYFVSELSQILYFTLSYESGQLNFMHCSRCVITLFFLLTGLCFSCSIVISHVGLEFCFLHPVIATSQHVCQVRAPPRIVLWRAAVKLSAWQWYVPSCGSQASSTQLEWGHRQHTLWHVVAYGTHVGISAFYFYVCLSVGQQSARVGFILVLGAVLRAFVIISSFYEYPCFGTVIVAGQSYFVLIHSPTYESGHLRSKNCFKR